MEIDYISIGQNIKHYRQLRKIKQRQLAEMIGVTDQHISHIECGATKLSLPVLIKISEGLDVDNYCLLGSTVNTPHRSSIDEEFSNILRAATPEQRYLCRELCRTVLESTQTK